MHYPRLALVTAADAASSRLAKALGLKARRVMCRRALRIRQHRRLTVAGGFVPDCALAP